MSNLVIAVDGFSSCGKSTVAKQLAKILNYTYIDSGAMYRCATLAALQANIIENGKIDEYKLQKIIEDIKISFKYNNQLERHETYLNNKNVEDEIRTLKVSENVSPISKIKFVRDKMVSLQRKMGEQKRIVMDGRDIGTIVFPNAELKIFMTADVDVRAKRRYDELTNKGEGVNYEEIKNNIETRDRIDQTRKESPLRKADDAIILDNSYLTREEQLLWILDKVEKI